MPTTPSLQPDPVEPAAPVLDGWRWLDTAETLACMNQDGVAINPRARGTRSRPADEVCTTAEQVFLTLAAHRPVPAVYESGTNVRGKYVRPEAWKISVLENQAMGVRLAFVRNLKSEEPVVPNGFQVFGDNARALVGRLNEPLQGVRTSAATDTTFESLQGMPMLDILVTALNRWERQQLDRAMDGLSVPAAGPDVPRARL